MKSAVADARTACEEHRWGDAWRLFSQVSGDALDVDDLDRCATAAFLTGRGEEGVARWGEAHQRCVDDGSVHRAAHFGMRLAQSLGFIGDFPRCSGWVDRTARLLDEAGIDCVEQGYLEHALGMGRLFGAGDVPGALTHFEQAGKVAARFGDRELGTLARIAAGRMRVYLGDVAEGMALLDESMVSIEAGELSTVATGDAYCTVIDACSELSDVVRCRAWTTSMLRWCDAQQELVLYRGHCFIHCAEVLLVLGGGARPWSRRSGRAIGSRGRFRRPSARRPASRATSSGSSATTSRPRPRTSGPTSSVTTRNRGSRCCASSRETQTAPLPWSGGSGQTEDPASPRPAARSVGRRLPRGRRHRRRPVRG